MKQLLLTIIFLLPILLFAQEQKGAISSEMLTKMQQNYKNSDSKGTENAIRHNSLKDFLYNQ